MSLASYLPVARERPIAEDLTLRSTECTSGSVLCERPTDTRQPLGDSAWVMGYLIAAGLAALIALGIWSWLSNKAKRGAANGAEQ